MRCSGTEVQEGARPRVQDLFYQSTCLAVVVPRGSHLLHDCGERALGTVFLKSGR